MSANSILLIFVSFLSFIFFVPYFSNTGNLDLNIFVFDFFYL